ncbi:REP-associated tyrosine transposase [Peribacillus loiseleuriae]|uniref:REP-associated tyrosine transposase n=1 Tax=Peribacillus loiseleuriae TaxID=1679170 RepID=UPI00382504A2
MWFPGAMYHITCRGNRRADIFYDDYDCLSYLHYLEETRMKYFFHLHAYCLMTNHLHLLLETKDDPTGIIMRKLNSRYAISFNKRHNLDGHVFQGRYHAVIIESPEHFTNTSRYIHLNPVKANIVQKPEQYKWSSYSAYAKGTLNRHITTSEILRYFQTSANYINYVQGSDPISQN